MKWFLGVTLAGLLLGCGGNEASGGNSDNDDDGASAGNGATTGAGGAGNAGSTGSGDDGANADGDCMTDAEEAVLGTNPNAVDSDADGHDDCAERDCVSDPLDANEKCYACGWQHNDPGTLVATGKNDGDTIGDMGLFDKCSELVSLWDFATEYHILFMTAAW